mmetsp:Transcript_20141/g.51916  ORF Transcript_20141/g.51916 Transcript_20141/m.51916 type:complete len:201 (+) Transcript_20141:687-1289(+)
MTCANPVRPKRRSQRTARTSRDAQNVQNGFPSVDGRSQCAFCASSMLIPLPMRMAWTRAKTRRSVSGTIIGCSLERSKSHSTAPASCPGSQSAAPRCVSSSSSLRSSSGSVCEVTSSMLMFHRFQPMTARTPAFTGSGIISGSFAAAGCHDMPMSAAPASTLTRDAPTITVESSSHVVCTSVLIAEARKAESWQSPGITS